MWDLLRQLLEISHTVRFFHSYDKESLKEKGILLLQTSSAVQQHTI